ncbi:MAG: transcriptional regulator, LuxR family, partial [Thermoleophilia bacterium]|nr:transcriptional regulator, LuxR family [Thermoleophilia bacterium]
MMPASEPSETPPLLQREAELDAVRDLLARAGRGVGGCLLVTGPPGIGKTAFLGAAVDLARVQGCTVLHGIGGELERDAPFGVVRSLFAPALVAPHGVGALLQSSARAAAPVFDSGGSAEPSEGDRGFAVMHALQLLVSELGEHATIVLVVDDLQWVDRPSRDWITYLARRLDGLPVALLLASRVDPEATARLVQQPDVCPVEPAPLRRESVEALMRRMLPAGAVHAGLVDACAAASGGNPFLLHELLMELVARPVTDAAEVEHVTPDRVAAWARVRLQACSDDARRVADAVAVLEPGTPPPLVADVAGVDRAAMNGLIAELVRADLLEGGSASFAHPLLRSAVTAAIDAQERARLHARAAVGLTGQGAPADQVAEHLLLAPPLGDPAAVRALRRAAALALERGSALHAQRLLQRAVAEAAPLDPASLAELFAEIAETHARLGSAQADAWIERALGVSVDVSRSVQLLEAMGRARFQRGDFGGSVATFDRAIATAGPGVEATRRLELECGWAAAVVFTPLMLDPDVVQRLSTVMVDSLEPRVVAQRIAFAHVAGVQMLIEARDRAGTVDLARAAWGDGALIAEAGLDDPATWAVTAAFLGAGELADARAVAERVQVVARANAQPIPFATASCILAYVAYEQGRLADVGSELDPAFAIVDAPGVEAVQWETFRPSAIATRALACTAQGAYDEARDLLAIDAATEADWQRTLALLPILDARGALAMATGDDLAALESWQQYHAHCSGLFGRDVNGAWLAGWRAGAAEALLGLGRRSEALALVDEELERLELWGEPGSIAR